MSALPSAGRALFPSAREVPIRLDASPSYRGSVHDDAVARRMGYKAALIPGAFIYGHISRVAVDAWGEDWIRRGRIGARFRRPIYNGEVCLCTTSELAARDDGVRADVTMRNEDGNEVAVGWIGMSHQAPAPPPLDACPILPLPDPPPAVTAGSMTVGTRIGSRQGVLTKEDVAASLEAFGEHHPLYVEAGFVHSGCLIRLTMADANRSFRFPSPVVFVQGEAQHYAPVRAGQRIATSGRVTSVYERRGKHYFESEEVLLADDTVAARFRRVSIYATD